MSSISIRLLLFNVLLVFLPAAGFFYLGVYESELLEAQERAMVQQGRLAAAALAGGAGRPEIDPAEAVRLLARLQGRTEMRLRVVDRAGRLLADSARLVPPRPAAANAGSSRYPESRPVARETQESRLYRLGAWLYRLPFRLYAAVGPPGPPGSETFYTAGGPLLGPEVRAALAGRYGAATRPTRGGPRSLTLYSALPVRSGGGAGDVIGAVLVSQSTWRILRALYDVRLDIFKVILLSVLVAAVLSLLVSTTIARPLRALRDEANDLVDRRGRLKGRFRGSGKPDEIGDLARALEQLTARLEGHLRFIEAFASDVSHELKNPLAAVRSATEMLAEVDDPADRERFLGVAQREVARMERLLSAMREITEIDARLDARLDSGTAAPVDLGELLAGIVAAFRERAPSGVSLDLALPTVPLRVAASPERLAQVFENLLDNAVGFAPPGTAVQVDLAAGTETATVTVSDRGPGIPPTHLDRIFDRFFTWRPDDPAARNGHTGLGLAIVKAIAEGYGGSVGAQNRPDGGAAFEVRLPAVS
jgi:two-component system sensor histidine kinase ChvG